jgi:hypothetical protein
MTSFDASTEIFRVARMTVPLESKAEFLDGLRATHAFVRNLEGITVELLLEGEERGGSVTVLTVVGWSDENVLARALQAARLYHAELDYDAESRMKRLGVAADIKHFRRIRDGGDRPN